MFCLNVLTPKVNDCFWFLSNTERTLQHLFSCNSHPESYNCISQDSGGSETVHWTILKLNRARVAENSTGSFNDYGTRFLTINFTVFSRITFQFYRISNDKLKVILTPSPTNGRHKHSIVNNFLHIVNNISQIHKVILWHPFAYCLLINKYHRHSLLHVTLLSKLVWKLLSC